ncbi:MAG: sensor histidine kinase FsrC [Enterococcus faecalis]|uniref:sensor histidine kinase FsrC n=1 Tax=Enterococcus TaxID=1350 RepID=UPI000666630C|nr:sensor histidine kinase FsrC [Enterococcus faecalis]EGO2575072.1 GHKL domain-containing protein [Enterococcus faecalis]EGO7503351.1 GHKL domain-containing protein [Enterococcus faecalis]MDK6786037.1 sensor histidine kinase FsrC [Enterococcus faecalis]MDK7810713.1 sensor histidine kinase FsrC [Enterococcus faecalis]MDU0911918.1 sensor histidine kinase FsrC [Enterococcus faecalis]
MILSLLATNVLLASSFIVFVFLRVTLIKIECKIPLLSLLIVINLCSFAALMLGYSWLIYALTVVIFTGFLLIHKKRFSIFKAIFLSVFTLLMVSFINYTEQTILSVFFQQIYQNKLLWIASNVLLLLINIWIALKIPNSVFLRLNRVLENSRIFFGCLLLLLILLLLFVFLISPEISPDFMRGFVTVNSSKLELLISVGLFLILIGLVIEAYLEEQRINTQLLNNLTIYTEKIESINEELAMFRHDYKNLLYSLQIAISYEDILEIKRIYEETIAPTKKIIDNEEFELMKLNRLKNMELKALISMKINTAKQAKLKVIVDVPEVFILDTSIDLVVVIRLLAILLDNAIENSAKSELKMFAISIFNKNETQEFVITNSVQAEFDFRVMKKTKFSSKSNPEEHGWGLLYVKEIVDFSDQFDLQTSFNEGAVTQHLIIEKNHNSKKVVNE